MKTIKIYGASDDLINVDGQCKGCDEYLVRGQGPLMGSIVLSAGESSIAVHCVYDGSWGLAVCMQEGDYDILPWPVRITFGKEIAYSQTVEIDVPDDCEINHVARSEI